MQTTWGSRAGADSSDSERMVRHNQRRVGYQSYYNEKSYPEKASFTEAFTNIQALAA